jgi:hypothetical protein
MGTGWARHGICELTWHGMEGDRNKNGMGVLWQGNGMERQGRGMACVD